MLDVNTTTISSVEMATAHIMASGKAGSPITLKVNNSEYRTGVEFLNILSGLVISTKAFGDTQVETCDTVAIKYFDGDQIKTIYVKQTLKEVRSLINNANAASQI